MMTNEWEMFTNDWEWNEWLKNVYKWSRMTTNDCEWTNHVFKKKGNNKLTSFIDILTLLFKYVDITLRIHWHSLVRSGKKVARSSAILHARCTRSAQITWFQKKLRSLLSWSSAFEICKNDSKRATFDVIIKSEIRTFLKLFQKFKVLMFLDERALKK
jgi:hypothetical protein